MKNETGGKFASGFGFTASISPGFQVRGKVNVKSACVETGSKPEELIHDVEMVASGAVPGGVLGAAEISPFGAVDADQTVVGAFITQKNRPGGDEIPVAGVDSHGFYLGGPALVINAGHVGGIRVEGVDHVRPGHVIAVLQAVGIGVAEQECVDKIQGIAYQPFQ